MIKLSNSDMQVQGKVVMKDGKAWKLFDFLVAQIGMAKVQGGNKDVADIMKKLVGEEAELTDKECGMLVKIVDANMLGAQVMVVAPVLYTLMGLLDENHALAESEMSGNGESKSEVVAGNVDKEGSV